jgi:hypothetical protein
MYMSIQENSQETDPIAATIRVAFDKMPSELKVTLNLLSVLVASVILSIYIHIGNQIYKRMNSKSVVLP